MHENQIIAARMAREQLASDKEHLARTESAFPDERHIWYPLGRCFDDARVGLIIDGGRRSWSWWWTVRRKGAWAWWCDLSRKWYRDLAEQERRPEHRWLYGRRTWLGKARRWVELVVFGEVGPFTPERRERRFLFF